MNRSRSRRRSPEASRRAQSETIGTILLVGVVVTAVGLFGAVFLSTFGADTGPLVSIEADGDGDATNLTHTGGERVPTDELAVTVSQSGTSQRYAFDDGTRPDGADDGQFEPGDRWQFDTSGAGFVSGESITVRLLHEPSNQVVATDRFEPA